MNKRVIRRKPSTCTPRKPKKKKAAYIHKHLLRIYLVPDIVLDRIHNKQVSTPTYIELIFCDESQMRNNIDK